MAERGKSERFCPQCGDKLPVQANFCEQCGARIAECAPQPDPAHEARQPLKTLDAEAKCPYCGHALKTPPLRKKKCPSCGQYIFVRTQPCDNSRVLATEEDAKRIDEEWERLGFLNRWLGILEEHGIARRDFEVHKEERKASDRDTIWAIFNELALDMMKPGHHVEQLEGLYYTMAMFLNEEGKDSFAVRQQSARAALQRYKSSGVVKKVEVLAADDSCEACCSLDRQAFTIAEALRTMPIPSKECAYKLYDQSRGFCRCCYAPIVKSH